MGTVLQFPGAPRQPDPEPEQAEPETPAEPDPWSSGTFLDWVYSEVQDFASRAADLATIAESDPDRFWSEVALLSQQIDGWRRA